jgi:hypothetical protein
MMANDEVAPVSDETKAFLEEVKKGKPRKFAMICKGAEIVSLVVYKKGGIEKRKKEAKESGKGLFYFGAIRGKGIDINFVLAKSDGFEKAPVKNTVLKSFLSEAADFRCKPIFEIVNTPQLVLDEDDVLVARFLKSQDLALSICDQFPDRAAEINTLCSEIGLLLEQDPNDPAAVKIEQLEKLLASLKSASSTPQAEEESTSNVASTDDGTASKLAEALKKLKPLMDRIINSDPNRKNELHTAMANIVGHIKAQELDQAKSRTTEFATLLKSLLAQLAPIAEDELDKRMREFEERRKVVEPRLLEAQKKDNEKATKLGTVWDYALGQAAAKNYDNAIKGLDRLATAIDGILLGAVASTSSDPAPKGIVAAAVTRLELQQVRLAAIQGVTQLEAALRETDEPIALEIAAIISQLARGMPTELEAILERFDQAVKVQDTEAITTLKGEIRAAAKSWLLFIEQHADHIAGCESNPWNIPVRIVQPIRSSLSAILKVAA